MGEFIDRADSVNATIRTIGVDADGQVSALSTIVNNQEQTIEKQQEEIDLMKATWTPPTTPPLPIAFMKVGCSLGRESGETANDAWTRRVKNFGAEPEIVRIFYPGLPTGVWPKYGKSQAVVSFKPTNVNAFIAGENDNAITMFLNTCAGDGTPKRITVWHEEEDDIEKGIITLSQARSMDSKLRDIVDKFNVANPNVNVRIGKVFMSWSLEAASKRTISNYMPTTWKFDWIGWDSYPGDTPTQDLPLLSATKARYGKCREASNTFGINNWFICETGTRKAPGQTDLEYDKRQADWITGAVDIAAELGCKGWMYFDSTVGGDFRIKGPEAFAAMGTAIHK